MKATKASFVLMMVVVGMATALGPLPTASAQDNQRQHDMLRDKIATARIDVSFDETAFVEAVNFIKNRAGIGIVVDPRVLSDVEDELITLSLRNASVKSVLDIMLDFLELRYTFRHGVIWITSPEEAFRGITVVRIYDVRDITMRIRDFPGTRIRLRGNDGGGAGGGPIFEDEDPPAEPIEVAELLDLIPQFTGGDSWETNPDATITQIMGLLVVRQSPEVHREVAQLLAQLRANK